MCVINYMAAEVSDIQMLICKYPVFHYRELNVDIFSEV